MFTQDGRIQIEGKDECRKRLGRSPDRADAVALAFRNHQGEGDSSMWVYLGDGALTNLATGEVQAL